MVFFEGWMGVSNYETREIREKGNVRAGEEMKWFLYNLLFGLVYTLMLPKFVFRMLRRGGYARHFLQRIGLYSDELTARLAGGGWIWTHAVSVGEMGVALRLMQEIRIHRPDARFVVSTNTSTAYSLAERQKQEQDVLIYFPLDCPMVAKRVYGLIKPKMLLLTECELWPNLIRKMHREKIPVVLYNGRLSDSSFRGYRKAGFFFREVLGMIDAAIMQGDDDRRRMIELGMDAGRVHVDGTIKYDMGNAEAGAAESARSAVKAMGWSDKDLLLVGGSTWPGEEEVLAGIFKRLQGKFSSLKLILVPRHAERRNEVCAVLKAAELDYVKKTDLDAGTAELGGDVLLVDTTGELVSFYAAADVVFVGKSLTEHGGQNFIEPAMFAKPILVGPNLENFPVVAREFLEARAMIQVADAEELEKEFEALLADTSHRTALGERAGGLVKVKSGAVGRITARILSFLE